MLRRGRRPGRARCRRGGRAARLGPTNFRCAGRPGAWRRRGRRPRRVPARPRSGRGGDWRGWRAAVRVLEGKFGRAFERELRDVADGDVDEAELGEADAGVGKRSGRRRLGNGVFGKRGAAGAADGGVGNADEREAVGRLRGKAMVARGEGAAIGGEEEGDGLDLAALGAETHHLAGGSAISGADGVRGWCRDSRRGRRAARWWRPWRHRRHAARRGRARCRRRFRRARRRWDTARSRRGARRSRRDGREAEAPVRRPARGSGEGSRARQGPARASRGRYSVAPRAEQREPVLHRKDATTRAWSDARDHEYALAALVPLASRMPPRRIKSREDDKDSGGWVKSEVTGRRGFAVQRMDWGGCRRGRDVNPSARW